MPPTTRRDLYSDFEMLCVTGFRFVQGRDTIRKSNFFCFGTKDKHIPQKLFMKMLDSLLGMNMYIEEVRSPNWEKEINHQYDALCNWELPKLMKISVDTPFKIPLQCQKLNDILHNIFSQVNSMTLNLASIVPLCKYSQLKSLQLYDRSWQWDVEEYELDPHFVLMPAENVPLLEELIICAFVVYLESPPEIFAKVDLRNLDEYHINRIIFRNRIPGMLLGQEYPKIKHLLWVRLREQVRDNDEEERWYGIVQACPNARHCIKWESIRDPHFDLKNLWNDVQFVDQANCYRKSAAEIEWSRENELN